MEVMGFENKKAIFITDDDWNQELNQDGLWLQSSGPFLQ